MPPREEAFVCFIMNFYSKGFNVFTIFSRFSKFGIELIHGSMTCLNSYEAVLSRTRTTRYVAGEPNKSFSVLYSITEYPLISFFSGLVDNLFISAKALVIVCAGKNSREYCLT